MTLHVTHGSKQSGSSYQHRWHLCGTNGTLRLTMYEHPQYRKWSFTRIDAADGDANHVEWRTLNDLGDLPDRLTEMALTDEAVLDALRPIFRREFDGMTS